MVQTLTLIVLLLVTWSNPQRHLSDNIPLCGLVKYIAAFLVVFTHLMMGHCTNSFWVMESNFGSKAVPIFLFFSGYGLMHSYMKKGETYLNGFVRKRLGKILLPLFVAYICYLIAQFCMGYSIDGFQIIKRMVSADPYLPYSWYVSEIVIIYFVFYVVARSVNQKNIAIVLTIIILGLLTCGIAVDLPSWWTSSTHCFLIGVWIKIYEDGFYAFMKKNRVWVLPILILLFFCTFNWVRIMNATGFAALKTFNELYYYIANFSFVVIVAYILMNIKAVPRQLTVYSSFYELYLVQGAVFLVVGTLFESPAAIIVSNLVVCVILSFLVYKFNQWLIQKIHL